MTAGKAPTRQAATKAIDVREVRIGHSFIRYGSVHVRKLPTWNAVALSLHLPLIAPRGCWFRVGNETLTWETGKAFVFDDTIEHEAANESAETRIVLIFNIWRPELTEAERGLVASLMEGIAGL